VDQIDPGEIGEASGRPLHLDDPEGAIWGDGRRGRPTIVLAGLIQWSPPSSARKYRDYI